MWVNTVLPSPWDFAYQGISRTQSPTAGSSGAVYYTDWDILSEVNEDFPIIGSERMFTPPPFMGLGYLPEDELGGSGRVKGFRGLDRYPTTRLQLQTVADCPGTERTSVSTAEVLGGRMSEEMVLKALILGGWS